MSEATHADNSNPPHRWIYRHSAVVRVTHWINVVCLAVLLVSGLMIFNAHPQLDWGEASNFDSPFVAIKAEYGKDGEPVKGVTTIMGQSFDTTGVLGLSGSGDERGERAFPGWITLPSYHDLAMARRWHFFFAWLFVVNGLVYLVSGFLNRHFRRDFVPSGPQLRHVWRSFVEHLKLRFPKGDEARQYNVLQKLAYLAVVFVLLPVMVLAGIAMAPALDAFSITALFGGRQSARTIHFIVANFLVLFVLIHVVMVLISGVWNNLRSMLTGRYDIEAPRKEQHDHENK
jgi:thiosulfate reductase cytochrome b subunit